MGVGVVVRLWGVEGGLVGVVRGGGKEGEEGGLTFGWWWWWSCGSRSTLPGWNV